MSHPPESRIVVFAIDDSRNDLELFRFQLEDIPGLAVDYHPFTEVEAALEQAVRTPPEIFFLDYFQGALSGIDIFERIKAAGLRCPAILLTGHGGEDVAAQALRAGVSDYISKNNISRAGLKRAITNALEKRRLQAKIEDKQRELEQACAELRRQNQEIQSFYHTLSHELKTPLTSAREFVSIVIDGLAGPLTDEQKKYLQIARNSCDMLTTQMNDLLDASRLENGKLEVHLHRVQPGSLVDRLVTLMQGKARAKELRFRGEAARDLPAVRADENRMIQVLTNLVGNALKFTPSGGEVVVKVDQVEADGGAHLRFSVTDTGPGIPVDEQRRIFDRLYQVGNSDTGNHGGLGLGLFLCQQLVKLHHGSLHVESEPGQGSTFYFDLPPAAPEPREAEVAAHAASGS